MNLNELNWIKLNWIETVDETKSNKIFLNKIVFKIKTKNSSNFFGIWNIITAG
jgi:hypothetical protein